MGMPLTLLLIILLETGSALFILGSAEPIISSKQPPLSTARKGTGRPVAAPSEEAINISSPLLYSPTKGLPPSPPSSHSSISNVYEGPNMGHNNNGRTIKPLGVDVHTKKRDGHGGLAIAVIAFSSLTALVICIAISWVLAIKCRSRVLPKKTFHASIPSPKPSGSTKITKFGGKATSTLMTHRSGSLSLTNTGSAKTFTMNDIKRATDNFNASRIVGEGGFGLVYKGTLDNGTEVAVKILKRNDQRGGREFFAEVEMLSRLHHRNLVKLIGICTEEHTHCLIYELIRNGSVASHLHGTDKETNPLDWDARMKIALGAARCLAYLHEDSSPRVIHRDFKSSNILLEYDFTPKVSDFGLARTALEEGDRQVSTHVMGTFGYLAPEYAMTGHLLVKSDVYSYGVVLLELLTGRKPVDLAQPVGQENLVAYARPLLTNREGLETIIDPSIKSSVSLDNVTKVAAIASMCIQAEVSHRPFMGEVVQALKLVCNELDETKEAELTSCGKDSVLINVESNTRTSISASDFLSNSMGHEGEDIQSFRRHSTSGNLTTGRRKQLWQILTSFSSGSTSDQLGYSLKSPQGKN
ncbi:hypothetical protein HS088_TW07G01078 [Tripterygium wilfordii]|uniref:Protein kinase domain-containing protein n=1 Tax=Tripterygium wilfordii TaxID=458696 RepID=A0A7J7DGM5_TRIWF|nr:hypothetical protein HS088_TW07G01078 [Tripterygium wilfordii]